MTDTTYKVHLEGTDESKTVSIRHPKLTGVTEQDFAKAGSHLAAAYDIPYVNTGLVSETTVHVAS